MVGKKSTLPTFSSRLPALMTAPDLYLLPSRAEKTDCANSIGFFEPCIHPAPDFQENATNKQPSTSWGQTVK